jgi:hypothetical protein
MMTGPESHRRLAELHPTLESLRAIDGSSVFKAYMQDLVTVQKAGEQVVQYVRDYYEVDQIKPQKRRGARTTLHDDWPPRSTPPQQPRLAAK